MAQQANVTLNSVVYAPAGTTNGVSSWVNRSGGSGASFSTITEKVTNPSGGQVVRELFTLDIPVVATEDTACVCAGGLLRTSTVQISIWIPQNSTSAERLDLWTRIRDLVASAPFVAGVENLDPSWG
jgi:hypothetical protein